ncbi:MAG: Sua5/YciO/YrdC/YwlC family protein [Candidatus Gracilibacteria bacterium]|nr:Sua5/YciO/YrdC/YwlC family protein [Candidatus Gracilibacteria bacterium]
MKDIFVLPTDTCYGIATAIGDSVAYKKIYKIKKRPFYKPLAILVPDLDWLCENTSLTEAQLEFLYDYKTPYTILTDCPRISLLLSYDDDDISYPNHEQYEKIAFRVAHTPAQKQLIQKMGPLFLTSANISGEPEIYTKKEAKSLTETHSSDIQLLDAQDIPRDVSPSDIFTFIGETTEIEYLRQNTK